MYISPSSHAENMIIYQFSGSRVVCDVVGKLYGGGSNSSIQRTIEELAEEEPKFPSGDLIVAYDNNQIIGRQYRVKWQGKIPISVITGVTAFTPVHPSFIQQQTFIPNVLPSTGIGYLRVKYERFHAEANDIHRSYRYDFISSRMDLIMKDCVKHSRLRRDSVAKSVKSENIFEGTRYGRVNEDGAKFYFHDQECIPINPNSSETVSKVFDHLLRKSEESDSSRNWIVVHQDGLPYNLGVELLRNTAICNGCGETTTDITKHFRDEHPTKNEHFKYKYEKLVLRAGNGHFEINLVRTIFNNFFDIYISEIAKSLGFRSPQSLSYCKSATDHHKSWQILQVQL
jgi:hypothetical protein